MQGYYLLFQKLSMLTNSMTYSVRSNVFVRIFFGQNENNLRLCARAYGSKQPEEDAIKPLRSKIGFIGDGNMAKAICQSIAKKGLIDYSQVYVSSPYRKNLDIWDSWNANVTTDNSEVARESDIIFLAVKPHILSEALASLQVSDAAESIKNKLFISILAGITLELLEDHISKFHGSRVIRIMPNTPMLVGEGCTAYTPGKNVTEEDISLLRSILEVSGVCQQVPEQMMNAVGALTGCGPAFIFLTIEALSDGAVNMGVHRDMANKFAAQTVFGAAKMVLESEKHTGVLKDQVCSAGGTTIAGMHALEKAAVRGAFMNAVEASTYKAYELAKKPLAT